MAMTQTARFLRLFGGCTDRQGTYSGAAAETIIPRVLGLRYGDAVGQQTSWSVIARHSDLVVSFGGLRLSNTQVTFGGQGPHCTRDWLLACRASGVRFVRTTWLIVSVTELNVCPGVMTGGVRDSSTASAADELVARCSRCSIPLMPFLATGAKLVGQLGVGIPHDREIRRPRS